MHERANATDVVAIETTLLDLANAIREVSRSEQEAFAVLERIIAGGASRFAQPLCRRRPSSE